MATLTLEQRVEIIENNLGGVSDSTKQSLDGLTKASTIVGLSVKDKLTNKMDTLEITVKGEMKTLGDGLKGEMKNLDLRLTDKMDTLDSRLTDKMDTMKDGLKYEMKTLGDSLRGEMTTLGKSLTRNLHFTQWLILASFAILALIGTGIIKFPS